MIHKQPYELKREPINAGVLTMTWGEQRAAKFGPNPAVVQLLVNNKTGPYNYFFSEAFVTESTIFSIEGLPDEINSILITVI